jgi:hypothetical protein
MLIARLDECGAEIVPVEAHVTGGGAILGELAAPDTVALMPQGTEVPAEVTRVALSGGLTLAALRALGKFAGQTAWLPRPRSSAVPRRRVSRLLRLLPSYRGKEVSSHKPIP